MAKQSKAEEIRAKAIEESNSALGEQINLTAQLADEIGFVVKQMQEKGNLDKGSVDLAREALRLTRQLSGDYNTQKDVAKDIAKNEALRNQVKRQQVALNAQALGSLEDELANNQGNLTAEAQQFQLLQKVGAQLDANASYLEEQATRQDNISDGMGFLGRSAEGLAGTLAAMGAGEFGKKLGLDGAAKKSKEMATELTDGGKKSLGFFGKMKVAVGTFGAALKSALGPIALLGMIKEAYNKGEEAAKKLSDQAVGLSRELGISQKQANALMGEIKGAGAAAGMTGEMAAQSGQEIYSAIGGTEKLTQSTLQTFMKLNTFAGMSAESLADIHKFAKLTGQDAGVVAEEMAGAAQEFIKSNKLNVNMKTLMAEAGKASSTLKLSIKGGGAELIKAVGQSKKLGLELKQVEDIAGGLLDIEESLAAEMEAELLTGKELNLEKAREAALNNDLSTVMSEISKQGIDQESFSKMNRMQQEAIAKSIGMTRDGMADMLNKQKENVAAQSDLVSETEKGTAAMESTVSAAEGMGGFQDMLAGMFAPVFEAFHPIVQMFQKAGAELIANIVVPIAEKLAPILMKIAEAILPVAEKIFSSIGDIMNAILDALMPIFDVIVKLVQQLMPVFEQIWNSISGAILTIIDGLKPVIEMIAQMAETFLPVIMQMFNDFIVPLVEKLAGVFVEIVQKLVPVFVQILETAMPIIQTILDAFMQIADAVLPAMISILDAVIPVVMKILTALKPIIDSVLKIVVEQLLPVIIELFNKLVPIVLDLVDKLMPIVTEILGVVAEEILPLITDLMDALLPIIMQIIDALMPIVTDILGVAMDLLRPIFNIFAELAKSILPLLTSVLKMIEPILKPVLTIVQGIFDMIIGIINGDFDKVKQGFTKIAEGLINLVIGLFEGIINLAVKALNALIKFLPFDPIPLVEFDRVKLAEGGIVDKPTNALIGEAGPEAVVPLNSDKSMNVYSTGIEEKLDRLIAAVEKGGIVYLDGSKVGETLALSTYRMQ